jgi:hypothetical protein
VCLLGLLAKCSPVSATGGLDNDAPVLNAYRTVSRSFFAIAAAPSVPVDANTAANAVTENAANGTTVGITAFSTDPDAGTTLTYSLTNNAGGRFAINASTGVVTVANGLLLDYETNSSHTITVQASDGALTSSQNFTITVTDIANSAYLSSTAEQVTRGVIAGSANEEILRIPVVLNANTDELPTATAFNLATTGTTVRANVAVARIYYTGTSSTFATGTLFGSATAPGTGTFTISGSQELQPGTNYFWLAYDVAATAAAGNVLDGTLPAFTLEGVSRTPTVTAPAGSRPVVEPGRVAGTALRLSGTAAGYVDLGDTNPNLVLGARYTLEVWVKPAAASGSTVNGVLGYEPGIAGRRSPYISISENGRVEFGFGNGTSTTSMSTVANVLPAGQWNQVVSTYDGIAIRLYINGTLYASSTSTQTPYSTPVRYIGTLSSTATSFFKGDVEEVALWTRALSQNEIRLRRHVILNGNEDGLTSYVQFNEASGNAADLVSGATGPLTGTGISRVASTAPLSAGTSNLQTIAANGTTAFPGTNAAINFTGVSGSFDVTVARLDGRPQGTAPSGLTKYYNPAYWIINKYGSGSFGNAAVTYTLVPRAISTADAAAPATTLRLLKRASTSDDVFDSPINATAANATASTVTFNLTSFSQTVIGTLGTSPLPVELASFTATAVAPAAVRLAWATASEKNSARFEVERSHSGEVFEHIGTVEAAGSSMTPRNYALLDAQLPANASTLYYRLRQVDADGTASYSPVRAVVLAGEVAGLSLSPNPGRSTRLSGAAAGAGVDVFDLMGRRVLTAAADATGSVPLGLPTGLASGVYVVRSGAKVARWVAE